MKSKKNKKVDLERLRSIFFLLGLVIVLGIVLFALEFNFQTETKKEIVENSIVEAEHEMVPITRQKETPPPPPPPSKVPIEELIIVDDKTEIEEELEIQDTEIDQDTEIELDIDLGIELEEEESEEEIFVIVEKMPKFPGGNKRITKWIARHIKYPVIAQENGAEGTVYIKFVIEIDGSVSNVEVLKGVDPYLDQEAKRVIESMPKWSPGKQRGKPVRVSYVAPIKFVLQ
jgi:protein TonB